MDAVILADFGTTCTKSTLLIRGANGSCSIEPSIPKPAEAERPLDDGGCVWSPAKFLDRMVRVVLEENLKANRMGCTVAGICCTATVSSIAALQDRYLVPEIPAIRWDDLRAAAEAASLDDLRRSHKACPWLSFGADSAPARGLWLSSRYADELKQDTFLIEQMDLISYFWTSRRVLSETVASRKWGFTQLWPWPKPFADAVSGLCSGHLDTTISQPLVEAATPIGFITSNAAENYGMPRGAQVIAAPYDTIAQVLGLGLLHEKAAAAVSLGTSMGVCGLVRDLRGAKFTACGPIPDMPFRGQGLLFDGLRSCGSAIDLVCTMVLGPKPEQEKEEAAYFGRVPECIRETPPGADGVSVVPYFAGGLRSRSGGMPLISGFRDTKQKHLVRAVFEGIAYHIKLIVDSFEDVLSFRIDRLLAGGGPSKNREFMQMVADVTGREVLVAQYPHSGLLGCAVCAAAGLGWYESPAEASQELIAKPDHFRPRPEQVKRYKGLYEHYRRFLGNELLTGGRHAA